MFYSFREHETPLSHKSSFFHSYDGHSDSNRARFWPTITISQRARTVQWETPLWLQQTTNVGNNTPWTFENCWRAAVQEFPEDTPQYPVQNVANFLWVCGLRRRRLRRRRCWGWDLGIDARAMPSAPSGLRRWECLGRFSPPPSRVANGKGYWYRRAVM